LGVCNNQTPQSCATIFNLRPAPNPGAGGMILYNGIPTFWVTDRQFCSRTGRAAPLVRAHSSAQDLFAQIQFLPGPQPRSILISTTGNMFARLSYQLPNRVRTAAVVILSFQGPGRRSKSIRTMQAALAACDSSAPTEATSATGPRPLPQPYSITG
jgi:hypothetical protein